MAPPRRLALAALVALVLSAFWAALAAAQAEPAPPLLYSSNPAAEVIAGGNGTLPGFPDAVRQGPADDNWPANRLLEKVSGVNLSRMSADTMFQTLAGGLARAPAGVGVDELLPRNWTVVANRNLAQALRRLGPDRAARVFLYVAPAFVSRIGTTDPAEPLSSQNATLVAALRLATPVLEMYHGDPTSTPLRADEAAAYPTRWLPRFPGALASRLRMMVGPDRGIGMQTVFAHLRATRSGRRMLANGPAAYGLRTREEGVAWLNAYADFLIDPFTSVSGRDTVVPALGGLTVTQIGPRQIMLNATLRARIVIQLLPRGGGARRVIGPYHGPVRNKRITVPPRLPAGRYTALTIAFGEGLREEDRTPITLGRPTG